MTSTGSSPALKLIEMQFLAESLIELITQTSTNLPPDDREAWGAPELVVRSLRELLPLWDGQAPP